MIVSGQVSIKTSSLSSFRFLGTLNISCYWPVGGAACDWRRAPASRSAEVPEEAGSPFGDEAVKIPFGCFLFFFFLWWIPGRSLRLFSVFSVWRSCRSFCFLLFSLIHSEFSHFILFFLCFFCFPLKRQPSQYGRQGGQDQDQDQAPAAGGAGGPVAAATEFEQTPSEIQVAGLLFQFFPEVRCSLVAVGQRRGGTGVEVIPVTGKREHSED